MSGPGSPSRLDKLRILEEWLDWQLRQTRNRIRELEIREGQEQQRREKARAELSWKLQPQGSGSPALLRRGGCAAYGAQMGFLNHEEAITAMNEPDIEPCQICNPQTGLV
ncbi:DUF6233 domain-containing protein [Streptomyces sp. NPDC056653]|uniref:DUF6233 domain-containing protein n=1 Tax=Streptomyces sp. NPDC056653 TaxID=3345894 RepID=UPI0036B54519